MTQQHTCLVAVGLCLVASGLAAASRQGSAAPGNDRQLAMRLFHDRFSEAPPTPGFAAVGVHFWFESERGERFTEDVASTVAGPLTLRLRSNTNGYVTVIDAVRDVELNARERRWPGYLIRDSVAHTVASSLSVGTEGLRLLIVFSRSQTEQVDSLKTAEWQLQRVSQRLSRLGGPQILRFLDRTLADQSGTYAVNRDGGPVAFEVRIPGR